MDDVLAFDGVTFYSLRRYGFPKESPNAFAEDTDGGIWIGTQGTDAGGGTNKGSLYRYRAGHVEKMLSGDVLSLATVGPGVMLVAVGTEVLGRPSYGDLYRLQKNGSGWDARQIAGAIANHMTVDHHGSILFPCPGGWCELAQHAVAGWPDVPLSIEHHAGDPLAERVLRDSSGCMWFRAEVRGSYQCPGDLHPTYLPVKLSQIDSSAHLEESIDGSIFMLVSLIFRRPGNFHTLGSSQLPPGLDTALLARDATIWLGTDKGLFRMMYPFKLEYWTAEDGLGGAQNFIKRLNGRIFPLLRDRFAGAPSRGRRPISTRIVFYTG